MKGLTIDHVIPKSRGGVLTDDNLVLACYPCNNAKGDKTPAEWGRASFLHPAEDDK